MPAQRPGRAGSSLDKDAENLSVRDEVHRHRSGLQAAVDVTGKTLSHPAFFVALLASHVLWVVLNLEIHAWFEPWDPYPFMFLATIASAEAPFLALLLLMHQKREAEIDELREELDLQTSLFIEREVTVILRMLHQIHAKLGIAPDESPETLAQLEQRLHPDRLLEHLRQRLDRAAGKSPTAAP
jgi:uncharacterized membrane protein